MNRKQSVSPKAFVAVTALALLTLTGCAASDSATTGEPSPTAEQSAAPSADPQVGNASSASDERANTLEDVWATLGCDGHTNGIKQDGNYFDRAGACDLGNDARINAFEFPSVGSLNTGMIMDLSPATQEGVCATYVNVAICTFDATGVTTITSAFDEYHPAS